MQPGLNARPVWGRFAPAILLLAVLAAYSNSFNGAFVFDDRVTFEDSPNLRSLWPIWRAAWANPNTAPGGRPLVSLSLALNYAISGERAWSYHAFNVMVHCAAAAALLGVLRRAFSLPRLAGSFGAAADALALAIAMIWAVHPLQTESVTYITTRTESMMGLCYLLTLYGAIRALEPGRAAKWNALAMVACACGVLCKENIASAPVFVVLFDRILCFGSWREMWRARGRLYAELMASWLVLGLLFATGSKLRLTQGGAADVTPWRYGLTQFGAIVHYLKLTFWPSPLLVDYFAWPLARSVGAVWPQVLIVVGLVGLTGWALIRCMPVGLLGAWFFLIIAPSSSVFPFSTELAAERRMYLPLAAVVTLVVCWAYSITVLAAGRGAARVILMGSLVCTGALGVLTFRQNWVYASEITFWTDQVSKWPSNPRAHNALGRSQEAAGRNDLALACFDRCLELKPDFLLARYNRGCALRDLGRLDAAVSDLRQCVGEEPTRPQFQLALGQALIQTGDGAGARAAFVETLRVSPAFPHASFYLGLIEAQGGRLLEAAACFETELRRAPDDSNSLCNLAFVLDALGRGEEARSRLAAAVRARPTDATVRGCLMQLEQKKSGPN